MTATVYTATLAPLNRKTKMAKKKPVKFEFAPGAFDTFKGTQEELDALIAEIMKMAEEGTLLENARVVDLDELIESDNAEDQALATRLLHNLDRDINGNDDRNLQ